MNDTVTFNVGGTIHKISRSLLEMHPQTMLAKSASELWYQVNVDEVGKSDETIQDEEEERSDEAFNNPAGMEESSHEHEQAKEIKVENEDDEEFHHQEEEFAMEIFIDRDGQLFRHVLNYLRDGTVTLPVTVAKLAILRELEYYGVDADASSIEICTQASARGALSINRLIQSLEDEELCVRFAKVCIDRYKSKARENEYQFFIRHDCADKCDYAATEAVSDGGDAMLDRCNRHLMKFGLDLKSVCPIEVLRQRPKYSVLVEVIDVEGGSSIL